MKRTGPAASSEPCPTTEAEIQAAIFAEEAEIKAEFFAEEAEIQSAILRYLSTRNADLRAWRSNSGLARSADRAIRFGIPGQADISGILRGGRRLEIEVKSSKGTQSKRQKVFQRVIEQFGGLYILARSVADVAARLP